MTRTTDTTIRTFRTRNFTINVKAVEDYDIDLSFDDTGEVRRDLESGKLVSFGVLVALYARGYELAADALGGCIYHKPADFMDRFGMRRKGHGSYFSDMIRNVIREGRNQLALLSAIPLHN